MDRHHITAKQKGQERMKICNNNGYPFIATLHNILLAPDLCDGLFSIITLMNSGHTYLFHKGICTANFGAKEKNAVALPYSAQRKHAFWGGIKGMSKTKKLPSREKIALELLHQRLVHISTRSLLYGYNANVWKYIELRIDTDPFCK